MTLRPIGDIIPPPILRKLDLTYLPGDADLGSIALHPDIILLEAWEKTKGGGLKWNKTSLTSYRTRVFINGAVYDLAIGRSGQYLYVLDIRQNGQHIFAMTSSVYNEVERLYFDIDTLTMLPPKSDEIIAMFRNLQNCEGLEHFDWRAAPAGYYGNSWFPGGNFVTPVRDQATTNACWAFSTAACLESRVAITQKTPDPTLILSVQNLLCPGTMGTVEDGGHENLALQYFVSTGITDETTLPFTYSDSSPGWPLTPPYTLYKATSVGINFIWGLATLEQVAAAVRAEIKLRGPVVCAMDAYTDFFMPNNPPTYSGGGLGILGVPRKVDFSVPKHVVLGRPGITGAIGDNQYVNHAVLITGYTLDESIPCGGYYHIKNSWGVGWGINGYGFSTFDNIDRHYEIHCINGDTYHTNIT